MNSKSLLRHPVTLVLASIFAAAAVTIAMDKANSELSPKQAFAQLIPPLPAPDASMKELLGTFFRTP